MIAYPQLPNCTCGRGVPGGGGALAGSCGTGVMHSVVPGAGLPTDFNNVLPASDPAGGRAILRVLKQLLQTNDGCPVTGDIARVHLGCAESRGDVVHHRITGKVANIGRPGGAEPWET
jgi:hypothetical protein